MTRAQEKILTIAAVSVALISLIVGVVSYQHSQSSSDNKSAVQQYNHIDIVLKDGKLVGQVSTYLVNPRDRLEFSITSDKLGKVGAPTDPPQTITFTQSPLVFHFSASTKAGSYPITYQAQSSNDVIQIGTVTVRSTR